MRRLSILLVAFLVCVSRAALAADAPELLFDKLLKTEGIAVCPDGRMFVAENETGNVFLIEDDKTAVLYLEDLGRLAGLACGADNRLVILDYAGGRVLRAVESEKETTAEVIAKDLKTPNGTVVAKDGAVYVSETDPGRIDRILPDGTLEKVIDGITFANGLALSDDESILYVASTTGGKILAVTLTGDDAGKKKTFKAGLQMIDGITRDPDGNFYACLYATGQVVRIAPDGALTPVAKGLVSPASPALRGGALYVTSLQGKGLYRIPLPEGKK